MTVPCQILTWLPMYTSPENKMMGGTCNSSVWCDKYITNCHWYEVVQLHHGSGFGVFLWIFSRSLYFLSGEEIFDKWGFEEFMNHAILLTLNYYNPLYFYI